MTGIRFLVVEQWFIWPGSCAEDCCVWVTIFCVGVGVDKNVTSLSWF